MVARKNLILPLACCIVVLMAGCNSSGNDPGPGAVTQSEADALDASATKLDAAPKIPESQTPDAQK